MENEFANGLSFPQWVACCVAGVIAIITCIIMIVGALNDESD